MYLQKQLLLEDLFDWEFIKRIETGPMELEELEENTGPENTKRTIMTLK